MLRISESACPEVYLYELRSARGASMAWRRTLHHRRGLLSAWYAAVSCILFFLLGNLLMLQSYHGFVDTDANGPAAGLTSGDHVHGQVRKSWREDASSRTAQSSSNQLLDSHGSDVVIRELAEQFLGTSIIDPRPNHYSVFESRLRRLLENPGEGTTRGLGLQESYLDKIGENAVPMLDCQDITTIGDREYIASGWTKAVFRGKHGSRGPVAIKTVDLDGQDMNTCMDRGGTTEQCYWRAAQKIMKEIVVLQALPHPNVLKVLGFCVPRRQFDGDSSSSVVMVTELGDTIDLIKLLQLSWEERLRISQGLTRLLQHLASSAFGSVAMNDFRRQQFVLVDGDVRLSDVDDVGFGDPPCSQHSQCTVRFSSANFTKRMPCLGGRCVGYNEQRNIFNAGRHFTSFLLPHGAPPKLRPFIDRVVAAFSNLTMSSSQLVHHLDRIVELYRSGQYLNRSSPLDHVTAYKELSASDLPGQFDYRCRLSLSGAGCTLSVFDQREAEDVCNQDPECRGFVLTNQKTWAGRWIVHLKNGVGLPSHNSNTRLFLRPS